MNGFEELLRAKVSPIFFEQYQMIEKLYHATDILSVRRDLKSFMFFMSQCDLYDGHDLEWIISVTYNQYFLRS